MKIKKKTIVVLYYTRGVYPLRDTIRTHLYCWKYYGKHRICYVNVAFGFPEEQIRRLNPDVIILHTIFLSMRWSKAVFEKFTGMCSALASLPGIKIALPQDEFIHTDMLAEYLGRIGVTHIGTCSYEQDWKTIYRRLWDVHPNPNRVVFRTVLTGYLDEATVSRIERMKKRVSVRDIDIGYRAWRAQFWLGEHGMHKVWVAEQFEKAGADADLIRDISLRDEDVLNGDDWFRFLLRCNATVGVEGGASLCDHDGTIRTTVDAYLAAHPDATFEQTRADCFPGRDHTLNLACISPRHLEACVTETCQALIEGRFSDILVANRDYIPIKKDYSNIPEVISKLSDREYCKRVAQSAYESVVKSDKWTYRTFVSNMETDIIDPAAEVKRSADEQELDAIIRQLNRRDWLLWRFIQLEAAQPRARTQILRKGLWLLQQTIQKRMAVPTA